MSRFDAILVLGGGVRDEGTLPPWVAARLDRAIERFDGEYVIPLSAGTTHKPPPLDRAGFPILEAVAEGEYLIKRGIPSRNVLLEACSYDTIGNAYFSRMTHTEPRNLHNLLVITSAFHMPRSEAIFRWVYGLSTSSYALTFEASPDIGLDEDTLRARREKEQEGLETVRRLAQRLITLERFHDWLFTQHGAYSLPRKQGGSGEAAKSY